MIASKLKFALLPLAAIAGSIALSPAMAEANERTAQDQITVAVGHGLQADATKALAALAGLPEDALSPSDRSFKTCMVDRFGTAERQAHALPQPASFSQRLIELFRAYWRQAMLKPGDRAVAEATLRQSLALELGAASDWPSLEDPIRKRLAEEGRDALLGQTGPLRELMIWGRSREIVEKVHLPDGSFEVRVVYLEDFASLGWGDWATCGRRGAGGWATGNALYAVTPRYESLDGEEFRVTFLGHETQHFADLARFPGMASWELEYRAKLTELAQARATRPKILHKFLEDRADDPAHPHGYANRKVLADLAARLHLEDVRELMSVDLEALNAVAGELVRNDTESRLRLISGGK